MDKSHKKKKCVQTHDKGNIGSRVNYVAINYPGFRDSRAGNAVSSIALASLN